MSKKDKLTGLVANITQKKDTLPLAGKEEITILPELENLIPPLSSEEFVQLEANIVKEGCRDPLVLWDREGERILIDGHNRYKICTLHHIAFKTELKFFTSLEEVRDWMINNQLGKRNLTEPQKSYLRGLQYNREKKKAQENLKQFQDEIIPEKTSSLETEHVKNEEKKSGKKPKSNIQQLISDNSRENRVGETPSDIEETVKDEGNTKVLLEKGKQDEKENKSGKKTIEKLAEMHKVSPKTIQRDEKFALGLDKLVGEDLQLKQQILDKTIKVPTHLIQELADSEDAQLVEELKAEILNNPQKKKNEPAELVKEEGSETEVSKAEALRKSILTSVKKVKKAEDVKQIEVYLKEWKKILS